MAITSTVGLGSGLDISSLVDQLVAAERAGPDQALNRREARTNAEISAIGKVKTTFANLQTAVDKLSSGTPFEARQVTSADTERLTARIPSGQTPALGSYQVEIESLASAQKLRSDPLAVPAADTELGTGTLQFTVDGDSFEVVVDEDNNDIYALAAAINGAADGKLQAAVLRGDDGFALSLTSGVTGSAGEISVTQTAGDDSLAAFTYDPEAPASGALSEVAPASDALFYIDGIARTASSNIVSDALDGVELTLSQAEVGQEINLTVGEDSSGAQKAVQSFVTAYNTALGVLHDVSAYDADNNTAAALNGDAFVLRATTQLRGIVGDAFRAASEAGVELGIDTEVDGSLTFDTGVFAAGLAAHPEAMKALYSGENATLTMGFSSFLDATVGANGLLGDRSASLDAALERVTNDREALDIRMERVDARYRKQFLALDSLLGQLNTTSDYLTQQLDALSSSNS